MTALIVAVLLTLFISAYCSLFEATLYSTRAETLGAAKASGPLTSLAERFMLMKRDISKPIAAILVLNTVSHTVGATMAGVYGVDVIGPSLMPAFSVAFTVAILLLTEILPKTLGAVYWRDIWPYTVWPLTAMIFGLYPVIWVTEKITAFLTRGKSGHSITEDEILAVVRMGQQEGAISDRESLLLRNIIHLEDKPVKDIMTPRTVIAALEEETTVEQAIAEVRATGFTRFPLYQGDRENIRGYVVIPDLYKAMIDGQHANPVSKYIKPISYIPESTDSLRVLGQFLKDREHIAVVVDEYGGIAGIVTLEDLIETVLGSEIVDEMDRTVDMREKAKRLRNQKPIS
jgi:CBS domain containing-hemolysin-like protein